MNNGTCVVCPDYYYLESYWSDADQRNIGIDCVQHVCESDPLYPPLQKLLVTGYCEDCPEKTYLDELGRDCLQDTCDNNLGSYVGDDGRCLYCDPY